MLKVAIVFVEWFAFLKTRLSSSTRRQLVTKPKITHHAVLRPRRCHTETFSLRHVLQSTIPPTLDRYNRIEDNDIALVALE